MVFIKRIGSFFLALFGHWWQGMSCAISTLLTFYAAKTNQPNSWVAHSIIVLAVLFLMVAAFGAWLDEVKRAEGLEAKRTELETVLNDRSPNLEIRLGQILTSVSADFLWTTFNVPIELINFGGRSACFQWEMLYESPGFSNKVKARRFYGDELLWPLSQGGHLVLDQINSIVTVASIPLERNDNRTGRAIFEIGGDRRKELDSGIVKITISCHDVHGKVWSNWVSDLRPAPELLSYQHERVIIDSLSPKLLD
jgi:hypothetical protein